MAATKEDIIEWFGMGVQDNAEFMIVVCDTYDYDDYPSYVFSEADLADKIDYYQNASRQRIMEVYSLKSDMQTQMAEHRAYHTSHFGV